MKPLNQVSTTPRDKNNHKMDHMGKVVLKRPPATSTLHGNFISDWEYDRTIERAGVPFHLWQCKHREGYTAYALTNQSATVPSGTSHFVDRAGLRAAAGIDIEIDAPNADRYAAMQA